MKAGKLVLFFVAGGLFGTGLAVSGMTDPARVIGFLDVFGAWNPALLFVMAGAVGVYGLGMLILCRVKNRNLKLPSPTSSPIDRPLVIGAAICPKIFRSRPIASQRSEVRERPPSRKATARRGRSAVDVRCSVFSVRCWMFAVGGDDR